MTNYTKPAVRNAWGETASGSDLTDPGNTYASSGWQTGVKPPRQYFNWVLNYTFAAVRYFCQQGMSQWDATETYPLYGMARSGGGTMYISLQNNNTNQALGVNSFWDVPYVDVAPTNDNSFRIANTKWVQGFALKIGSTFSAIAGSIAPGQVPVGAVTQWQGALTISGSQVNSAVARANTLYLTSGNYAQFNWSGQAGQPSWLFGSNDGTNVYVWNPANFSVNNSSLLAGLAPNVNPAGNTIPVRDSGGNLYAQYHYQSSPNSENPSVGQVMVTNGADNWLRKINLSAFMSQASKFVNNANGIAAQIGPFIIQGGSASVNGTTTISFPTNFNTACVSFVLLNLNSTNQIYEVSKSQTGAVVTNGTATVDWIAIGF